MKFEELKSLPPPPEKLHDFLKRVLRLRAIDIRKLVQASRVTVDGDPVIANRTGLVFSNSVVTLDGVVLDHTHMCPLLLVNKPAGFTCSTHPKEKPLVFDLLPKEYLRPTLHLCGRLDRNTTGLLLLSYDSDVSFRLMHPESRVFKRYRVAYSGELCSDAAAQVANVTR